MWWRVVTIAFAVILWPLSAVAAALPLLIRYDTANGSSTTTRTGGTTWVPRERGAAVEFSYDETVDRYDRSSNVPLSVSVERWAAPSTTLAMAFAAKGGSGSGASGSSRPSAGNFAPGEEASHFAKHAGEFQAGMTQQQYADGARQLLNEPAGGNVLEKVRPNGDVLKYNTSTNDFAVMAQDGTIRTFFRPTAGMNYWSAQ